MKFQAPWCKKCAAMQDDWDSLADYFQGTEVIIADIDGTTPGGKSLRKRFGVRRYPTFKCAAREGSNAASAARGGGVG
eukprot:3268999-Prymnesium_polylepis.1